MTAQSSEKFTDACDVKVTDEDGFLSAASIMKERI